MPTLPLYLSELGYSHLADVYGRGPVFFYSFLIIILSVFVIAMVDSLSILAIQPQIDRSVRWTLTGK
jgi:hypothetical protein